MLPCDQVIERLWEFVDGELDDRDCEAVQAHLDICARCFPEYDFRQAYRRFMSAAGNGSAPVEVRRRVFAAILEEERRGSGADGSRGGLRRLLGRWLPRSGGEGQS